MLKINFLENKTFKQQGFTLIELMTAISLSFLLLMVLLTCYLHTVNLNVVIQALNTVNDNAKAAISLIGEDIMRAGDIGCSRLSNEFPINHLSNIAFSPQTKLTGDEHSLTVRYINWLSSTIQIQADQSHLMLDKVAHLHVGDIIAIATCERAEITNIKSIKAHTLFLHPSLENKYANNAAIGLVKINHYFIAKTPYQSYALYREDINHQVMGFVSGIDALFFTYTLFHDGKLWFDLPAKAVNDWSQVVGVAMRMHLSASSIHKIRYAYFVLP